MPPSSTAVQHWTTIRPTSRVLGGVFVCEGGCFHMGVRWLVDRFTIRSTPRVPITPRALMCDSVVQSQNAVSAHFSSKQILPFGFAEYSPSASCPRGPSTIIHTRAPVPLLHHRTDYALAYSDYGQMDGPCDAELSHYYSRTYKVFQLSLRFPVRTLPIPIITLLCK